MVDLEKISEQDGADAIEIADRVWWVGHYQEGDPFQCHVYLIEHGDQSILFDPGSRITIPHTLRKIQQVVPFTHIRYFVCHHQDPDITAAMPLLDELITRPDAVLVTHWRAKALLKHYALTLPFWLVDENDWRLDLGGRELRFIFTPYAHFPGAFVTFDQRTGILFSSDLFGGFTEGFSLVAKDEGYFESLRPFHEHYMPSRDILAHAIAGIEKVPVAMIAPQHGSIIPPALVRFMITKLKSLECGLYLLSEGNTDIKRLSRLNATLRDIIQTMVMYRDFGEIAARLLSIAQRLLPVTALDFWQSGDDGTVLELAPETRYVGRQRDTVPDDVAALLGRDARAWQAGEAHRWRRGRVPPPVAGGAAVPCLLVPLFTPERGVITAVALFRLAEEVTLEDDHRAMIEQMAMPLQVAVEREGIYRALDQERQRLYARSIRDALTGLFTRFYMEDVIHRLFTIHDRDSKGAIGLAMIDIDHFKLVNDTYGHIQGDEVLRRVAQALLDSVREGDLPVRLGGEEFALFAVGASALDIDRFAERMRRAIAALTFDGTFAGQRVTVSVGTAMRHQTEPLADFISRADAALYRAKRGGRNQVCRAEA